MNKLVTEEFDRLSQGRPHIVLDEIFEFQLRSGGWVVSTDCIGLLFSVDRFGLLTPVLAMGRVNYPVVPLSKYLRSL